MNRFSIYLFQEGVEKDKTVDPKKYDDSEDIEGGTFYWKKETGTPLWISDFFGGKLKTSSKIGYTRINAVYVKEIQLDSGEKRIFAVCFGNGRFMLDQSKLVKDFGIKAALNAIDATQIRSIDSIRMESIPLLSRIQSSKLMDIDSFRLDVETDMLRNVYGVCEKADISTSVTGKESLCVSNAAQVGNEFDKLMRKAFEYYSSTDYQTKFKQYEQIKPLDPKVESSTLDKLEEELLNKLNSRDLSNIWIGVPDILEWDEIKEFKIGDSDKTVRELDLLEVIDSLKFYDKDSKKYTPIIPSIEKLKVRRVTAMKESGVIKKTWSVYDCLCSEMLLKDHLYILMEGKWYKIDKTFQDEVNRYYKDTIRKDKTGFIDAGIGELEDDYNKKLNKNIVESLLMDKQFISHGGGRSKFELCDVLTKDKKLIHIKKYSGSSVLSHLFYQGFDVGEMLKVDPNFVEKANKKIEEVANDNGKLPEDYQVDWEKFKANDYEIIYGIITKKRGIEPSIPFFSKIAIKQAHRTLKAFGYNVSVVNIYQPEPPKPTTKPATSKTKTSASKAATKSTAKSTKKSATGTVKKTEKKSDLSKPSTT